MLRFPAQTTAAQQLFFSEVAVNVRFEPVSPTTHPRFAPSRSTANASRPRLVPVPHGTVNRHRSKPQRFNSRRGDSDHSREGVPTMDDVNPFDQVAMAEMYRRVRRKPIEGTLAAAIRVHSQACGFVAYAFDVHPDVVARAVAETDRAAA